MGDVAKIHILEYVKPRKCSKKFYSVHVQIVFYIYNKKSSLRNILVDVGNIFEKYWSVKFLINLGDPLI
jgi:DUF1365 family protein